MLLCSTAGHASFEKASDAAPEIDRDACYHLLTHVRSRPLDESHASLETHVDVLTLFCTAVTRQPHPVDLRHNGGGGGRGRRWGAGVGAQPSL